MNTLKQTLNQTLVAAMKVKEQDKVNVLRSVQAAIKQVEVDKRIELNDTDILSILQKQVKQRQESLSIYKDNGRNDLAEKEQFEIDIISQFLPTPLTEDELKEIVSQVVTELQATSIKDMGKVMNEVKTRTAGKAEPSIISVLVKKVLSQ